MTRERKYYDLRNNVILISVIVSIWLGRMVKDFNFPLTWVLNLLILGNVRRLKSSQFIQFIIRITFYFLHLAIFSLLLSSKYLKLEIQVNYLSLIILSLTILIYIYINFRMFLFTLSDNYIATLPVKYSKSHIILLIYSYIGAAICEELYFRMTIINFFTELGIYSIFISAIYFFLFHYTVEWGDQFKIRDSILQLLMGAVFALIYYLSRDIKLVMIGHLLYNIPHIYIMLKLYHRDYINPNHYQKLLIKDDFDDLLI
ncbi:CPBP family intramembrane metalloprotease [Streptococcus suis]|uniref:CPBP family intramembrane glutamic endopeptidase n=2 Tax=Streptococcus suis TaxID=1307 RepID=UPI0014781D2A|nr:CPBP family intramembrane glutamic endopeptidase [Streptococcus suis]MCB2853035.1 CPBP family intramembrane metalloprotease [Streptococcus suis]MCB2858807.1 CPBP family intramembrane metalloprotease [Streptococcus suis]MCB2865256.1 CPBP family intramembrane metalloprotease [Streptococcus suis]MCB2867261.1 CPBP family intramembrane metalloprotease [Streptococcus suis]MCB2871389.1 CPBP family intramembrane metalloprotease [Streptococcus suis]